MVIHYQESPKPKTVILINLIGLYKHIYSFNKKYMSKEQVQDFPHSIQLGAPLL